MRARTLFTVVTALGAALSLPGPAPNAVATTTSSPSLPGSGYVLDWENAADRTVPGGPPPQWTGEYKPALRHADDGEPQVRIASAAKGEPVRAGSYSARFEIERDDPVINNGTRAELGAELPAEPRGAERWYGFSTYLPTSFTADRAPESIVQWHQEGDVDCSNGCSPPLSLFTRGGHLFVSQNWARTPGGEWVFDDTDIGPYVTGRWTDWVFHVKWSTGDDGLLQIWKDGTPLPGFEHKVGRTDDYGDGVHGNYMKIGLYKWPWSQNKPSDTTRRVLYLDELRTADEHGSYDSVAPRSQAGHLSVSTPLAVTPSAPTAGAKTTVTFTVVNDGGSPVTVEYFLAGARDSSNRNVDFPATQPVTLQPGGSYQYTGTRTFDAGQHVAWPAYYDGADWHELGPHVSFDVKASASCSPGYGQFGGKTWPPGCWRPYADTSAFNQPVPANPTVRRDSAQIIGFLTSTIAKVPRPDFLTTPRNGFGGEPTYWVHSSDPTVPRFTIHCLEYCANGVQGMSVPIPAGAVPEAGVSSPQDWDRHLTVVDQDTGIEYDMWRVHSTAPLPATGGTLDVGSIATTHINGDGREELGSATAALFGDLAGRVRAEEVQQGTINHALFIDVDCDNHTAVYPAKYTGQRCQDVGHSEQYAPPMGSWLQLDMSDAEINAPSIPAWERPFLRAMARYGMYIGDTGSEGYFSIEKEGGNQYTSQGAPDPWLSWGAANDGQLGWSFYAPDDTWVGHWTGVDWKSKLRVLCRPEDTTCPR